MSEGVELQDGVVHVGWVDGIDGVVCEEPRLW